MKINHAFCSVLFAQTKWELIRTGLVCCELKYARFHICWSGAVYNWQWYWCLFNLLEFIIQRYLLTSSYFWHTYMMQNKFCTITRSELSKSPMQCHRWFSKIFLEIITTLYRYILECLLLNKENFSRLNYNQIRNGRTLHVVSELILY